MSADRVKRLCSPPLALRGIAAEGSASWLAILAIFLGVISVLEITNGGRRHGVQPAVFVQVLIFGSMWLNRLPSTRLLLILPQTRRQSEMTAWLTSFALPVCYYATVFGCAALWCGWHGHRILPALLMMLDGVALQGMLVLAWSFRPDSTGRIGWPGWTNRSATRLSTTLGFAAVVLCFSPGFLPGRDARGAALVAVAAGLPAALLVWLRRDTLLKRCAAATEDATTASVSVRGWLIFLSVFLPSIGLTLTGSVGVPLLMLTVTQGFSQVSPILFAAPLLFSCVIPLAVLQGLRALRMLPVSSASMAIVLIAAMAVGPAATCLVLTSAWAAAPAMREAALTSISWAMPTMAATLPFLPMALRFERLWLMAASNVLVITVFSLGLIFYTHGTLPRLSFAGDLGAYLAVLTGSFLWLRWEIAMARGNQLRAGASA